MMHIRSLDLNLLVVAGALYRHQNVSKAAKELGLSQSAVSHALARLRVHFQDPLFVRTSKGVAPTALAREARGGVLELLRHAESLAARRTGFDPATARDRITISTTDYFEIVAMPELLAELRREAPSVQLSVRPTAGELPKRELEAGTVDLAVAGFYSRLPEGFYQAKLLSDTFRVAAARSNSRYSSRLSLEEYFSARHALITLQGDFRDDLTHRVGGRKLERKIAYGSFSFTGMAWILQDSDLLLTAPSLLLRKYQERFPIRVWDGPLDLGRIDVRMVWHAQTHQDPLRQWLRGKLKAACARVASRA
jgi:DNA-binding transcriptional LysR family regulator